MPDPHYCARHGLPGMGERGGGEPENRLLNETKLACQVLWLV